MTSDVLLEECFDIPIIKINSGFFKCLDNAFINVVHLGVTWTPAIQEDTIVIAMETIEKYLDWKRTYAQRAAKCYRVWLHRFYEHSGKDSTELVLEDLQSFLLCLEKAYSVGTRKFVITVLKDHCLWLRKMNIVDVPYELIRKPKGIPNHYKPIRKEEYKQILAQTSTKDNIRLRDTVMLRLFFDTGIRVGEMSNMLISNIEDCSCLIISEKSGGKQRRIFWSEETNKYLKKHLKVRASQDKLDWLFISLSTNIRTKLSIQTIQTIIKEYSVKAGVQISCHQLRSTWATERYRNGVDLRAIQWGLGHASIRTTQIYVQPEDSEMEKKLRGQFS